jgi:PEP-CTERM motif
LSVFQGSTSFFQGDPFIFTSQSGAPNSYVAANFNNATEPGTINSWLITPQFSTATAGSVTFWARGDVAPGFSDTIAFGMLSSAPGAAPAVTAPTFITAPGAWTQYTVNFAAAGPGTLGRFAMVYTGPAATSAYIGIDTLTVTAVPEPGSWLLMGAGLLAMGGLVQRRSRPRV